jgi:hypothetical protein
MPNGTCRIGLPTGAQVKVVSLPARPLVVGAARIEGTVPVAGVGKPVMFLVTESLYDEAGAKLDLAKRREAEEAAERDALAASQFTRQHYSVQRPLNREDHHGLTKFNAEILSRFVTSRDYRRSYRVTAVWVGTMPVADEIRAINRVLESFEVPPPAPGR